MACCTGEGSRRAAEPGLKLAQSHKSMSYTRWTHRIDLDCTNSVGRNEAQVVRLTDQAIEVDNQRGRVIAVRKKTGQATVGDMKSPCFM